jgi:hypothetical protein
MLRTLDVVCFIPCSAVLSSLATIAVFWRGVRTTLPRPDRRTAGLLVLLYVTSFVFVSTMGVFYRSGKPWLAPALLALAFLIVRARQSPGARRDGWMVFLLATVIGLLDRQGHYYVMAAFALLLLEWWRVRRGTQLLVALGAAALVVLFYNAVLGPVLIHAVNGYWPRMGYQLLHPRELVRMPWHLLRAAHLVLENMAVMLGGYLPAGALVMVALGAFLAKRRHLLPRGFLKFTVLGFALQVAMFALMIARHRYVYEWVDHRQWYYPLPLLATVLFWLALVVQAAWPELRSNGARLVQCVLVLVAASNLLSLGQHRDRMLGSHWFVRIHDQSRRLGPSLRSGIPDPGLDQEYARFAQHVQQLRSR